MRGNPYGLLCASIANTSVEAGACFRDICAQVIQWQINYTIHGYHSCPNHRSESHADKGNLLLALTATGPDKAGKLIHRWLACTLPVCVSMGGPEHPWVPVRNDDSICAMIGRAHIMS